MNHLVWHSENPGYFGPPWHDTSCAWCRLGRFIHNEILNNPRTNYLAFYGRVAQ